MFSTFLNSYSTSRGISQRTRTKYAREQKGLITLKEAVKEKEGTEEIVIIEQLIELGEEQGYVLLEDILKALPQAEVNLDLLDDVFGELLAVGIPFSDNGLEQLKERIATSAIGDDKTSDTTRDETENEIGNVTEAIDAGDLIGVYFNQASRVPLLMREDEIELAKRIERGRNASKKMAKGSVSSKKRTQLEHRIDDGLAAREHLILANLRLVFSVAKKYMRRGVPLLDLIQEGHIGLMRAAKKFDYRRGFKFSTYATWWIRQAVTRAIADHGRTIRLPVHMGDRISKMYRTRHQLTQELGRDPTIEELAEELGESPLKVKKMIRFSQITLSLEQPVGDEDDATLGDFIEDTSSLMPEESVTRTILEENVQEILEELPAREVRVLQLRFGLWGERMHTLHEAGKRMGVTRERVRQIQSNALKRLRMLSQRERLMGYIGS
jgi:RNA polymerase primary sigma factor